MTRFLEILSLVVLIGGLFLFTRYSVEQSRIHRTNYAIQHNCKWDYNDMCYTKEQRPWLFKD